MGNMQCQPLLKVTLGGLMFRYWRKNQMDNLVKKEVQGGKVK